MALVAVLLTSAVAAVAVISGPPSAGRSALVATEIDARASVRIDLDKPAIPEATSVAASPPPTTRARVPVVVLPVAVPNTAPATEDPPAPIDVYPAVPPAVACVPISACIERRPAPAVAPTWTVTQNGVTVTATMTPAAPQVGDTVTISYTAKGADACCWVIIDVGGAVVHDSFLASDRTCPAVPSETSGTATMVMTKPGNYGFRVAALNGHLCKGPGSLPQPPTAAYLYPVFWVNPLP